MYAPHTCPFLSVHRIFRGSQRGAFGTSGRKLDGLNPAALLVDDLKQNPAVDKFNSLAALEAILRRGCP